MPGRKQDAEEWEGQIFLCDLEMDGNAWKGWNPGNVGFLVCYGMDPGDVELQSAMGCWV